MIETPVLTWQPVLPELLLAAFAIVGLLYEAFVRRTDRTVHLAIALAGIAAPRRRRASLWYWTGEPTVMGGMVAADKFAVVTPRGAPGGRRDRPALRHALLRALGRRVAWASSSLWCCSPPRG